MEKEKKKFSVIKAMSWYAIGNILVKGVALFVLPLFSDLMSTYENGVFTSFTSYGTIIESIILLGLSATIRISKYDKDTDYDAYTATVLMITFSVAALLLIGVNLILFINPVFLSFDRLMWNILIIDTAFSAACIILGGRMTLDGHYLGYFIYLVINTVINLGVSLGLIFTVFKDGNTHMAKIYAITLANIVCFIYMYFFLGAHKPDKSYIRRALSWGSPLIVHTFLISLFSQLATLAIQYMTDFSNVGIYGMAITLLNIPQVLLATFENAWNPWFFDTMNKKEYSLIKKFNSICYIVFASLIAEFILIVPDGFHLFINKNYWDAIYCLIPLSIDTYISFLYYTPLNTEYFYKSTKNVMFASIISSGVELVLLYVLIKRFGLFGAGYALVISRIVLLGIHTYFARKLDENAFYDKKIMYGSIVLLFIIDIITSLCVNNVPVRLTLFVLNGILMITLVIKNRKELLKLFN